MPPADKQQQCHPLACDWCGGWRYFIIQRPDSKTGAMLLSLLFLSPLQDMQHPVAATRGQCTATLSGNVERAITELEGLEEY